MVWNMFTANDKDIITQLIVYAVFNFEHITVIEPWVYYILYLT